MQNYKIFFYILLFRKNVVALQAERNFSLARVRHQLI